jgi:hypothetical protein
VPLPRLEPARQRTVVLLGHEWHGVSEEQVVAADMCVEMIGQGASLNVAVAGVSCPVPVGGTRVISRARQLLRKQDAAAWG